MKQNVPIAAVVAAIVVLLAIVGFVGFRTVTSGGEAEKVHVDANTVKESIKNNGFGGGH